MTSRKALGIIGYIDIDGRYPYPNYLKDRYKKEYDIIMEVVERDTPMKPKVRYGGVYKEYNCSVCNSTLDILGVKEVNFCPKCGKRIDWSKSND